MNEPMQKTMDEIKNKNIGDWMLAFILMLHYGDDDCRYPSDDAKELLYYSIIYEMYKSSAIVVFLYENKLVKLDVDYTYAEDGSVCLHYYYTLTSKGEEIACYVDSLGGWEYLNIDWECKNQNEEMSSV